MRMVAHTEARTRNRAVHKIGIESARDTTSRIDRAFLCCSTGIPTEISAAPPRHPVSHSYLSPNLTTAFNEMPISQVAILGRGLVLGHHVGLTLAQSAPRRNTSI